MQHAASLRAVCARPSALIAVGVALAACAGGARPCHEAQRGGPGVHPGVGAARRQRRRSEQHGLVPGHAAAVPPRRRCTSPATATWWTSASHAGRCCAGHATSRTSARTSRRRSRGCTSSRWSPASCSRSSSRQQRARQGHGPSAPTRHQHTAPQRVGQPARIQLKRSLHDPYFLARTRGAAHCDLTPLRTWAPLTPS